MINTSETQKTKINARTSSNIIRITNSLTEKDYQRIKDTCERYMQLRTEFSNNKVSTTFKDNFTVFYVLRHMEQSVVDTYFRLFETHQTSLESVLDALKKSSPKQKYYLSYATKLLNMFEQDYPIYDQNVALLFDIKHPSTPEEMESIVSMLREYYEELLLISEIKQCLEKIKISNNVETLTDNRLLDILLWVLGDKIKEEKENNTATELHTLISSTQNLYKTIIAEITRKPENSVEILTELHALTTKMHEQGVLKGKSIEGKKSWDKNLKNTQKQFLTKIESIYSKELSHTIREYLTNNSKRETGYKKLGQHKQVATTYLQLTT